MTLGSALHPLPNEITPSKGGTEREGEEGKEYTESPSADLEGETKELKSDLLSSLLFVTGSHTIRTISGG